MAKHQSSCKCDRCRRTIELRKAHARRVFERTQGNLFAKLAVESSGLGERLKDFSWNDETRAQLFYLKLPCAGCVALIRTLG